MRKIINKYFEGEKLLTIWESKYFLFGEVKMGHALITKQKFNKGVIDAEIIESVGMPNAVRIYEPKINKMRRVIWTNDDYDEWKDAMIEDGEAEETLTYDLYYADCDISMDDERCNLDVEVDGYIIAFASLGLWHGSVQASKIIGSNVKDILSSNCDYCTWFCDPFNVRFEGFHHDGRNSILYRVAKSREQAERLMNKIAFGGMSEEQFRKATKSLRPYVANVYGW